MGYYQTGDVLYKQINKLPIDLKAVPGNIIHNGYSHQHAIEGDFELLNGTEGFFVLAKEKCNLLHAEHKTIELEKGIYKKEIVIERDHFLEESREVID